MGCLRRKLWGIVPLLLWGLASAGLAHAGINRWTQLGPGGDQVHSMAVDPRFPDTVYANSYRDLYKSTDGGVRWTRVSEIHIEDVFVLCFDLLMVDPHSSQILYGVPARLGGLCKSNDGGLTWSYLYQGLGHNQVLALVADPRIPGTLLASNTDGIFKSTDRGRNWTRLSDSLVPRGLAVDPHAQGAYYACCSNGLYRSTDGGVTWLSPGPLPPELWATNLAVARDIPGVLYLAGSTFSTEFQDWRSDLYRSNDGGVTWFLSAEGLKGNKLTALEVDSGSHEILYTVTLDGELYRSTDGAATWQTSHQGLLTPGIYRLAIPPNRPGVVYATGVGGFYKSTNAGSTWHWMSSGLGGLFVRSLAASFNDRESLYVSTRWQTPVGSPLGVFKSGDGGSTWAPANNGLPGLDVPTLAVNPKTPEIVYAGTDVGVFKSTDKAESWLPAKTGMGDRIVFSLAVDPADPDILYSGTSAGLFKSTNGGSQWVSFLDALGLIQVRAILFVPELPGTIYLGTEKDGIFKTVNGGKRWFSASDSRLRSIRVLAVHPRNPQTIYAGGLSGVFKTHDGGKTWIPIHRDLSNPCAEALAPDPNFPDHLYLADCMGAVRRSIDGGMTWPHFDPGSSLRGARTGSLVLFPDMPPTLLAASDKGLHHLQYDFSLEADFSMHPPRGHAPLTVAFQNESLGYISAAEWDFGDGHTSRKYKPDHVFKEAGTYPVTLSVLGPGGSNQVTKSVPVLPPPPRARFRCDPHRGKAPLEVSFTNTSQGSITRYLWKFGDGETCTETHPRHVFSRGGTYRVTLRAFGPEGTGKAVKYIHVKPPPPEAQFSSSPTAGLAPLEVRFTNRSTGDITSNRWDFGDGTTSTVPNPSHTFKTPGTFPVTLQVKGPGGTDSTIHEIRVQARPGRLGYPADGGESFR